VLFDIRCGDAVTSADLKDGEVSVGGGATDAVRIPGLKPSLLTLRIEGERLTVIARRTVSIGKTRFPAHVERLVVPGEVIRLGPHVTLAAVRHVRPQGTRTVMRGLLRGALEVSHTRAATLTCLTGIDAGRVIPLGFERLLIGRGDECALQIRDRAVSRRHARLSMRGGVVTLEDLRTANGTFVNGRRILQPFALTAGDVLELGQTLLRYDDPARAGAEVPTLPPTGAGSLGARPGAGEWPVLSWLGGGMAAVGVLAALLAVL
jgi:hypothetical protein